MKRTRSSPSVSRDTSNRIQLGRRCIKRDYVDFWPKIEAFLDIIFADCTIGTNRANTDKSFQSSKQTDASCHRSVDSFESCYRLVYSCVINSHGERLANDLFRKVKNVIQYVSSGMEVVDAAEFILNFYVGVIHLLGAFDRVQGIFLYLDKNFLIPKMGFEVESELTKLLKALFFDIHGEKLLSLLSEFVAISEEPSDVYGYLVASFRRVSPEILARHHELDGRYTSALSTSIHSNEVQDLAVFNTTDEDHNVDKSDAI